MKSGSGAGDLDPAVRVVRRLVAERNPAPRVGESPADRLLGEVRTPTVELADIAGSREPDGGRRVHGRVHPADPEPLLELAQPIQLLGLQAGVRVRQHDRLEHGARRVGDDVREELGVDPRPGGVAQVDDLNRYADRPQCVPECLRLVLAVGHDEDPQIDPRAGDVRPSHRRLQRRQHDGDEQDHQHHPVLCTWPEVAVPQPQGVMIAP